MLRRKTDNTFEFRDIERALYGAAPYSLSAERREALRARIFSQLGAQDVPRRSFGDIASERWITIPVGASIAASVIAATHYLHDERVSSTDTTWVANAAGSVTVDGVDDPTAEPGQRIEATGPSWVAVGKDVRVGLETGSAFRFASSGDRLALLLEAGTHHIVSQEPLLEVRGQRWTARMTGPGALEVSIHEWYSSLAALEGEAIVQFAGNTYLLRAGDRPLLLMAQPPDAPGFGPHTGDSGPAPANGGGNPNPGLSGATEPDHGSRREDQPPASAPANGLAGPASDNEESSDSAPTEGVAASSDADTPAGPPEGVPPSP
ncbi:MAG: hypothetical protein IH609_18345, partial [Dehalococcoidia bacterium]|nr:hypothetical protein [Dehalococcoidia bacterium]